MSKSIFARNQLIKHGWTDGAGLGKTESGIKEAIKVKIKNDTTGVGHDPGKEFTNYWWDDVFNKTASSIHVEHTEDGATVRKSSDLSKSKDKNRSMLYGRFVKGATLKHDVEEEEEKDEENSEDSDEEGQSQRPPEEEVFRKCGGRTAHKGARHGLKLNGKLERVKKMEEALMNQMMKKVSANDRTDNIISTATTNEDLADKLYNGCAENTDQPNQEKDSVDESRKSKKKKEKKVENEEKSLVSEMVNGEESKQTDRKKLKKKKKDRQKYFEENSDQIEMIEESMQIDNSVKKKRKKKKQRESVENEINARDEDRESLLEKELNTELTQNGIEHEKTDVHLKRKNRKRKHKEMEIISDINNTFDDHSETRKKKKKRKNNRDIENI